MTQLPFTAQANAAGIATVNISPDKGGIQWTVGQLSVECQPARGSATAEVQFNGRYVTSTPVVPQTASQQPFITLQYNDVLAVIFRGLTLGDTAVVTIFYKESLWGEIPNLDAM